MKKTIKITFLFFFFFGFSQFNYNLDFEKFDKSNMPKNWEIKGINKNILFKKDSKIKYGKNASLYLKSSDFLSPILFLFLEIKSSFNK
jgi:hypothetical protein